MNHGSTTVNFQRIPVLADHISIPPHDVVADARHSYSFDEAGTGLCFHSPTALPDGSSTLADFLKAIAQGFLGDGGKVTPDTAYQELVNLSGLEESEEPILPETPFFSPDDPIGSWLLWGDMLRHDYDIEQYAFVSWEDL